MDVAKCILSKSFVERFFKCVGAIASSESSIQDAACFFLEQPIDRRVHVTVNTFGLVRPSLGENGCAIVNVELVHPFSGVPKR